MTKNKALEIIEDAKKIFGYVPQRLPLREEVLAAMSFMARQPIASWELLRCDVNATKHNRCGGEGRQPLQLASREESLGKCPVCGGYAYLRVRGPRRGQLFEHAQLVDELSTLTLARDGRIALAREQTRNGQLPDYCIGCGCFLEGGRTQHEPACPILAMIQEAFPGKETKEGQERQPENDELQPPE